MLGALITASTFLVGAILFFVIIYALVSWAHKDAGL